MKLLGIRFCAVSGESANLITFLENLGLSKMAMPGCDDDEVFEGGIFDAGDSWIEIWQSGDQMPEGTMLQLVVDNVDEYFANARSKGLEMSEPMEAHGEKICYIQAPGGLQMSIQSKMA